MRHFNGASGGGRNKKIPLFLQPFDSLRVWILSWPSWVISVLIWSMVLITVLSFFEYFFTFLKQRILKKVKGHQAKAKQKIISYAIAGGLVLVILFFGFVFNRLQVTKKQKNIIEAQKQEVEQQKEIVEKAHLLRKELPDFANVCSQENLDYLDY